MYHPRAIKWPAGRLLRVAYEHAMALVQDRTSALSSTSYAGKTSAQKSQVNTRSEDMQVKRRSDAAR
ncbi:hypothetical protein CMQ_7703 [Grosmannia clavigera kw1407]|uniref:Uncharacterized protein n=1 Tax=Grosmannia clavigera (strain kw1407 / UAMH 11150) TaxID=655863 RepID=F0XP97_GROCL|nr:uncharacterized protein CMQ_7703 [Grosmannia clavigera kw1407]EFX00701.1 hypothetical protein CMQ_7703 [Grosmannia clavigera kw1407]